MAERAAELFHEKRAPLIVFSGFAHPDFGVNEAEVLANRAIEFGVPLGRVIREPQATNTGLNILLSAKALQDKGVDAKRIILVHRPFMTRRFMAAAEAQWPQPQPKFYVTSANYDFMGYFSRESKNDLAERSLAAMLKDYASIKEYAGLGFQSRQPFLKAAENAYRRLVEDGFKPMKRNEDLATKSFTN